MTNETLDCGHIRVQQGCAYGTCQTTDGRTICLNCAEVEEVENLKTATDYFAYLASDKKTVTTWTGGTLGFVTAYWQSKGRWSSYGIVHRCYVHVMDVHGVKWYGSGPVENGDYVRLHRANV